MQSSENKVFEPRAVEIPEGEPKGETESAAESAAVHSSLELLPDDANPSKEKEDLALLKLQVAMASMLELLNQQLLRLESQDIHPKSLAPLAKSLTETLKEVDERIYKNEGRQAITMESALKTWAVENGTKAVEEPIAIETIAKETIAKETMRTQSQQEMNQILRVMWLGTGMAAGCVAAALYLLHH